MVFPLRANRVLLAVGADIALTLAALFLAGEARLTLPFGNDLNEPATRLTWQVYALTAVIWLAVFSQWNLYTRRWARFREEWWALALAVLTALLILSGGLYFSFRLVSRLQILYFGALDLLLLTLLRIVLLAWRSRRTRRDRWRVLIAGASQAGRSLAARLIEHHAAGVQVIGFLADNGERPATLDGLPVLGALSDMSAIIQRERIDEVVLALPNDAYERMLSAIMELERMLVQVSLVPDVLDLAWFRTRAEDLNGVPLLRLRESPLNGPARALKRLMDMVLGAVLLALATPVLLIAALLVRLDSTGPVIIRQKRIGENAQPFGMFKLRTMRAGAEREPPAPVFEKKPDDPRITRIGRVLRRYSIDELPQLLNVLRGEMSLVGPRPELPWLVDRYEPWQRHRFAVPPGMTGWWQVNGRSERPMPQNVEDDLYYIRNYSLWLDVAILLRTIPVVLLGKGAY